ncbi:MAG: YlxR family protein, partial [Clostridia bacterium]|nr:YlxR family protein [Clostridia bacterium]
GAYICNSPECLEKIKKQKVLNRAFKCEIPLSVCEKICEELIDNKP